MNEIHLSAPNEPNIFFPTVDNLNRTRQKKKQSAEALAEISITNLVPRASR